MERLSEDKSDHHSGKDQNDRQQRVGFLRPAEENIRGLRTQKSPEHKHQQILEDDQRFRLFIVQESERDPEEHVVCDVIPEKQEQPVTCRAGEDPGKNAPHRLSHFPFRCHRREVQADMEAHQDKGPIGHRQMEPPGEGDRNHSVEKRYGIAAHRHSAEGGQKESREQEETDQCSQASVSVISAFEQ